jgi:eukaryotic-like serine/threonine-protein kinase
MALTRRVWGAGKLLILVGALLATFFVFAAAAMRVALRASEVEVPDLRGRAVREASAVLEDYGLTMRVDDNRRLHPNVPEGYVAQQDPAPGSRARRQRSVKVWLSAGGQVVTVPDIVGQTERTAQMLLQQDGLGVAAVAEIRSGNHPTDAVVAQTPAPGARGHEVSLLVNRGEATATYVMPDLIGLNGERAAEFLRGRGFRVAVVGNHPYPGVEPGVVIRQTPAGGFQVAPGEAISLEVSR